MRRSFVLATRLVAGAIAGIAVGCSSGGSGGSKNDDDTCVIRTQLSGGIDTTLGETSQACVYSARSVAFAPLDARVVVGMIVRKVEAGQTGTFDADMTINAGNDRWGGAKCTIEVESNVPDPLAYDAGLSFNPHLLRGKGSCATPATFLGDGGTKPPVEIGPFTFTFSSLFY